jgi:Asp-tRNA(Asn)/Glu-tRNA(Gln) amidotransferase C subunit
MKLTPEHIDLDWFKGKQISKLNNDSISILISFDRTLNNNYLFDVEVTNNSEKKIIVSPELFSYKVTQKIKNKTLTDLSTFALDPEIKVLELQKSYSLHKSEVETQNMFYALGYFLQFANQTKALVTNDVELSNEVDENTRKMKEDELLDDVRNQRIQESLSSSSYFWEMLALRKTTLRKNESISGKVFFPVDVSAKTIDFCFPINEKELHISFNQEEFLSKRIRK